MAGPSTSTFDEAIHVVVTPSQASYFAGEPFSVTITFTNTRTPQTPVTAPRSASQTHRRGAHSISSVPLSRPPTSPGLPRTPASLSTPRVNGEIRSSLRKGLIGHGLPPTPSDELPPSEVMRKRLLASRSLSVSLSPTDLSQLKDSTGPNSSVPTTLPQNGIGEGTLPSRIVAPLARAPGVPPNHPHARKHSIVDGQLHLQDLRPPSTMSPFSHSPHASMSTFSLSLDPIDESGITTPGPPGTPYIPSPILNTNIPHIRTQMPGGHADMNGTDTNGKASQGRGPSRRPSQLGLGLPPSLSSAYPNPPRAAFSSAFPVASAELILYAYAQVLGTLTIASLPDHTSSPDQTRNLNRLRSRLLRRKAIGGGCMDITSSLSTHSVSTNPVGRKMSHGRSSSLSAGLLSIITPTSLTSSSSSTRSFAPGHRARTSSVFSLFSDGQVPSSSRSGAGPGFSAAMPEEEVDPETPLPTFEVQPTMLAVDLSLSPGETRSYTYTLALPENLPPTYRGRALKFSYQFVLGICRAGNNSPGANPTSNSRVMKVPIRVYNYVTVGRPPAPYNLLWPVTSQSGSTYLAKVTELSKGTRDRKSARPTTNPTSLGTYEDLQGYARNLLASFPDPKTRRVRIKVPIEGVPPSRFGDTEHDHGNETGCRQAVEVLTRNPKKASYDVNKDGNKVAVLTFPKSAYRLGETILGVVELNERSHRARVLKLSALLEAHESLPSSIASPTHSRQMRRVHAEHHSCFIPATFRIPFSLDIPPDATPAFQADLDEEFAEGSKMNPTSGGLEWKVRICLLVAVASANAREGPEGVRTRHLIRDGLRGQWGSVWKAAHTIAPSERPSPVSSPSSPNGDLVPPTPSTALSWVSYFTSSFLGPSNVGYHDGDEDLDEDDDDNKETMGPEDEWREVKVEMVECEVPVKVWPGNTAFKATEVVFDV